MQSDTVIGRRILFLLNEANSDNSEKDQSIIAIIRSISNYETVGHDGDSKNVKLKNKWMSSAAYDLAIKLKKFDLWHKETTNEHEFELKYVWTAILEEKKINELNFNFIYSLFKNKPFITVTNDENTRLRKIRHEVGAANSERYKIANILVGSCFPLWNNNKINPAAPNWIPR